MRRYLLVSLLAMASPAYATDVRPFDMPAASALSGTEAIWCQQGGSADDRKCSPVQLGNYVAGLAGAGTGGITKTIATGTAALGTSSIASGTCGTATTVTATGVVTTDIINAAFNGDPTAVTGYTPTAMLTVIPYPTADHVNFKQCNLTALSITPSALTINWSVKR